MSARGNIPGDLISRAERTSIRLLLDKHGRGASPAQTMALLDEVARLESLLRAADEPEAKNPPEARGCDARRCSKHVYSEVTLCEFCCLPLVDHLVFDGARRVPVRDRTARLAGSRPPSHRGHGVINSVTRAGSPTTLRFCRCGAILDEDCCESKPAPIEGLIGLGDEHARGERERLSRTPRCAHINWHDSNHAGRICDDCGDEIDPAGAP